MEVLIELVKLAKAVLELGVAVYDRMTVSKPQGKHFSQKRR